MYTYSTWHSPTNNSLRACLKLKFVFLSLSSKIQIGASALLSMRYPQHFDWCKGLKWLSKRNACFVQHLYSSNLTLYVHMYTPSLTLFIVLSAPQGYFSIPDTGITLIIFLTREVFSISDFFIFHSYRRLLYVPLKFVYVISNPRERINTRSL